jgi:hypothetical protein
MDPIEAMALLERCIKGAGSEIPDGASVRLIVILAVETDSGVNLCGGTTGQPSTESEMMNLVRAYLKAYEGEGTRILDYGFDEEEE